MRLLQYTKTSSSSSTYTFSLTKCDARYGPQYAILSHRWGADNDEVSYHDIGRDTATQRVGGYKKLQFCAQQAERDGLLYFWVDTCCIDKSNNTELSEAINSMYKWYQNAAKCYVYLSDVSIRQDWLADFRKSEWFKRGWTLQELIAPRVVEFFSKEGIKLGSKRSLKQEVQCITGISVDVLQGKALTQIDERERLSWTAQRQTSVEEDAVYCLFGIFDVHMPLLYGEGQHKALSRLRREVKAVADSSLVLAHDASWNFVFRGNRPFQQSPMQKQTMELQKMKPGLDHPITRTSMAGLVLTCQDQGRKQKVEQLQTQMLKTCKAQSGMFPQGPSRTTCNGLSHNMIEANHNNNGYFTRGSKDKLRDHKMYGGENEVSSRHILMELETSTSHRKTPGEAEHAFQTHTSDACKQDGTINTTSSRNQESIIDDVSSDGEYDSQVRFMSVSGAKASILFRDDLTKSRVFVREFSPYRLFLLHSERPDWTRSICTESVMPTAQITKRVNHGPNQYRQKKQNIQRLLEKLEPQHKYVVMRLLDKVNQCDPDGRQWYIAAVDIENYKFTKRTGQVDTFSVVLAQN